MGRLLRSIVSKRKEVLSETGNILLMLNKSIKKLNGS